MTHQVGIFGDFTTVDTDFALGFGDTCRHADVAVAVFGVRGERCRFRAYLDELFIVANSKRRARAKVKDRLGAIRFALCVFTEKDV